MQFFLPTTLLVLLSTRLTSAAPVYPQTNPSISTSNCIDCHLTHDETTESPIIPFVSIKPKPVVNSPRPYADRSWESSSLPRLVDYAAKSDGREGVLLSIEITRNTLPSRPLHKLPKEEQANFWTKEYASRQHSERKKGCHNDVGHVYLPGGIYVSSDNNDLHKMDMIVMGVVMFFLVLLVCVEAAGTIKRQLTKVILSHCTSTKTKLKQGEIFLSAKQLPHTSSVSTTISEKAGLDGIPRE